MRIPTVVCLCGNRYRVPPDQVGKHGKCPACGRIVQLGHAAISPVPAAENTLPGSGKGTRLPWRLVVAVAGLTAVVVLVGLGVVSWAVGRAQPEAVAPSAAEAPASDADRARKELEALEREAGEDYTRAIAAYERFLARQTMCPDDLVEWARERIDDLRGRLEDRAFREAARAAEAVPLDPARVLRLAEDYLKQYPGGRHVRPAQALLVLARSRQALHEIELREQRAGDRYEEVLEAYRQFLERYPSCPAALREQAQQKVSVELPARIDDRDFARAQEAAAAGDAERQLALLGAYLKDHPEGRHARDARQFYEAHRPLAPAEVRGRVRKGVAVVSGKFACGTGFLVAPGLLATSARALANEQPDDVRVRFLSDDAPNAPPVQVRLLHDDKRKDLAFLSIPATAGDPLELAPALAGAAGQRVTVLGTQRANDGAVRAAVPTAGTLGELGQMDGEPSYETDLAVPRENSGGPVLDASGKVIGMVSGQKGRAARCVPLSAVRAAREALGEPGKWDEKAQLATARHLLELAFLRYAVAGPMCVRAIDARARANIEGISEESRASALVDVATYRTADEHLFGDIQPAIDAFLGNTLLPQETRDRVWDVHNYYVRLRRFVDPPRDVSAVFYYDDPNALRTLHARSVEALKKDLDLPGDLEALVSWEQGP
jgi:S1-C subfamily serine protease